MAPTSFYRSALPPNGRMTPEEIKFVWNTLAGFGLGAVVAFAVAFLILRFYLPSYLSEKGKNLATKEDIGEITNKVEEVKNQYAMLVEQFKAKNQMRMAALDKRLQVHQDAFVLWRKLVANAHSEMVGPVVMECQTFWEENCLYLEPAARQALSDAYVHAASHRQLVQGGQFMTSEQRAAMTPRINESWAFINSAGKVILESVALPPLTEAEAEQIAKPPLT